MASLCVWAGTLGLIGDIALHAHSFVTSALLAMAAASAVVVLG
jgi:hypothetical protein